MSESASRAEKVPSTRRSGRPDEKPSASITATRRSVSIRQPPGGALIMVLSVPGELDRIGLVNKRLSLGSHREETVKHGNIATLGPAGGLPARCPEGPEPRRHA